MAKDTLRRRFEGAQRPVRVIVDIPVTTLIRVEGIAGQMGLTLEEALREAVGDWMVRREAQLDRGTRLEVERAMRAAWDHRPVQELLEDFRRQMQGSSPRPLTSSDEPDNVVPGMGVTTGTERRVGLEWRDRREAVHLTRTEIARRAGCSTSMVRLIEKGYPVDASEVAERLDRALKDAEHEMRLRWSDPQE